MRKTNMFTSSMFDSIKEQLESPKGNTGAPKDFIKTVPVNNYLVRLVPNLENPKHTIFHYFDHMWQNPGTGQWVHSLCPTTHGDRCPICEYRFKLWRQETEDSKDRSRLLKRREKWMTNCYVITDPTTPENEGHLKILRYGKQLDQIIKSAINGADASEFGAKIFDLSKNGCNLRVSVENNSEGRGTWPTYVMSRFIGASVIKDMTDERIEELHSSTFKLEEINSVSTYAELEELLSTHFNDYTSTDTTSKAPTSKAPVSKAVVEEELEEELEEVTTKSTGTTSSSELDDLLAGLED